MSNVSAGSPPACTLGPDEAVHTMLEPEVCDYARPCTFMLAEHTPAWIIFGLAAWCVCAAHGNQLIRMQSLSYVKRPAPSATDAGPDQHHAEPGCAACWQAHVVRGQLVTGREEAYAAGEQTSSWHKIMCPSSLNSSDLYVSLYSAAQEPCSLACRVQLKPWRAWILTS